MSAERILIFSRFPRLGKVKTRLNPPLSKKSCCRLHLALLLDTLDRTKLTNVERQLFLSDCSEEELQAFARAHSLQSDAVRLQKGSNLGERMWNAYREIASSEDRVIFLGTDSPSVPLDYIRKAFTLLEDVAVVIGPVPDGGYYLLGLAEPRAELLSDITWGSERVVSETTQKLLKEEYRLLPEWYDVDRAEDLARLTADLQADFEGYPNRTRFFLSSISDENPSVQLTSHLVNE